MAWHMVCTCKLVALPINFPWNTMHLATPKGPLYYLTYLTQTDIALPRQKLHLSFFRNELFENDDPASQMNSDATHLPVHEEHHARCIFTDNGMYHLTSSEGVCGSTTSLQRCASVSAVEHRVLWSTQARNGIPTPTRRTPKGRTRRPNRARAWSPPSSGALGPTGVRGG